MQENYLKIFFHSRESLIKYVNQDDIFKAVSVQKNTFENQMGHMCGDANSANIFKVVIHGINLRNIITE